MRKTYKYRLYPTTAKQHAPWSRLTAAVEDLNVKGLARGMLPKSVTDAGWSAFIDKLTYKAAGAGRVLVQVNPRGTESSMSLWRTCAEKLEPTLASV